MEGYHIHTENIRKVSLTVNLKTEESLKMEGVLNHRDHYTLDACTCDILLVRYLHINMIKRILQIPRGIYM